MITGLAGMTTRNVASIYFVYVFTWPFFTRRSFQLSHQFSFTFVISFSHSLCHSLSIFFVFVASDGLSTSSSSSGSPISSQGFSALELFRKKRSQRPIFTTSHELDAMLGSGIRLGEVTEFCEFLYSGGGLVPSLSFFYFPLLLLPFCVCSLTVGVAFLFLFYSTLSNIRWSSRIWENADVYATGLQRTDSRSPFR